MKWETYGKKLLKQNHFQYKGKCLEEKRPNYSKQCLMESVLLCLALQHEKTVCV